MRGLKTAVKIWKKELEFKILTWGIKDEERENPRKKRQEFIRNTKAAMASDLLSRNRIGDIIMVKEDLEVIQNPSGLPTFRVMEGIYRKYL